MAQEAEEGSYFEKYLMPVMRSRRLPAGLIVEVEVHSVAVAEKQLEQRGTGTQTHFVERIVKYCYCNSHFEDQ